MRYMTGDGHAARAVRSLTPPGFFHAMWRRPLSDGSVACEVYLLRDLKRASSGSPLVHPSADFAAYQGTTGLLV
jgi:hypothetical protein